MTSEQPVRRLHVFEGDLLRGRVMTTDDTPRETYVIEGVTYDVLSYLAVINDDGTEGFDVQVVRRS